MGDHYRYDPDDLLSGITNKLNLVQIIPTRQDDPDPFDTNAKFLRPYPVFIQPSGARKPAKLYLYDFKRAGGESAKKNDGDEKPTLTFGFLLWDPLTRQIKNDRLNEKNHPRYVWFNGLVKDLVDRGFSDAVLYSGRYRVVMQQTVEQALCSFMASERPRSHILKTWDPTDCPVDINATVAIGFISHSLGSIMLYDAILDMANNHPETPMLNIVGSLLAQRAHVIYMLANQLPLLDLSQIEGYPVPAIEDRAEQSRVTRFKKFLELRAQPLQTNIPAPELLIPSQLNVVGVSDPDDDLSYHLPPIEIQDPNVRYSNIYVWNAFDWLVFANPYTAHTDYVKNSNVIDMVVCGMTNGSTNKCQPW